MSAPLIHISSINLHSKSPLELLQEDVDSLSINALPNYHKRIMVKALKAKYLTISILKVCEVVGIKISTYYYKPKRPYLPGYVHERKVDPLQFDALKEQLQSYDVDLMDNASKRHLVWILSQKYDRLTIRKICQMVKIKISSYYYKPVPVLQSLQKIRLKIKVDLFFAHQQELSLSKTDLLDQKQDIIVTEDTQWAA